MFNMWHKNCTYNVGVYSGTDPETVMAKYVIRLSGSAPKYAGEFNEPCPHCHEVISGAADMDMENTQDEFSYKGMI